MVEWPFLKSKISQDQKCKNKIGSNKVAQQNPVKKWEKGPTGRVQQYIKWQDQKAHTALMQEVQISLNSDRVKIVKCHQEPTAKHASERRRQRKKAKWSGRNPTNL